MNRQILSLDELKVGERAKIVSLLFCGSERRRMLDFGMIAGTYIEAVQKSPAGDPVAYFVRGTLVAIRSETPKNVWSCDKIKLLTPYF